jgi:hypothetical protein
MMKTCNSCKAEKPLDQFYMNRGKREGRCKKCRGIVDKRIKERKIEAKILAEEVPETACPCDSCWKQPTCEVECASFKCWSEFGV